MGGADLHFLSLSQTPVYTARGRIRVSASRSVPVFTPTFTDNHFAYPRRDGQAELTWMASWLHTEMVYPPADGQWDGK